MGDRQGGGPRTASCSAWWPGGRMMAKPLRTRWARTASVSDDRPPHDVRAAVQLCPHR